MPKTRKTPVRQAVRSPHPSAFRVPRSSFRVGFTLLEIVIALSLTIVLLTAVYGAIRLQYRLSSAGRDQLEQAQLSRAILRQIESDIRSVVWQVQEPPSTESDKSSSSSQATDDESESTESDTESMSSDDAFTSASSGIFGDSQNLVVHINQPPRTQVVTTISDDESAAESGQSDLASVSYFLADSSAGGLSAAVAQANGGGSSVLGGVVGLARMEGDRLTIEQAGAESAVDYLAQQADVLAPEVVAIEFAYWDGIEWLDSWDSMASGGLPSAISITLSIDTTIDATDRTRAAQLSQAVTTGEAAERVEPFVVRYVVAVPLAEPYVGEASF